MSLGFGSISESAIGEIPVVAAIPNLFLQIFSEVSVVTVIPVTTLELSISYGIDQLKIIYYGGNRNTWTLPLEISDASTFLQKFSLNETASLETQVTDLLQIGYSYAEDILLETALEVTTSTSFNIYNIGELNVDATTNQSVSWRISDPAVLIVDPLTLNWNIFLNNIETAVLEIDAIERIKVDDDPSAAWNIRPGLPISPIGYNSIGIEQFDGGFTSFPDESAGLFNITTLQGLSSRLNFTITGILDIGDESNTSTAINDYSALETTVNGISSFSQKFNFIDTTDLEQNAIDSFQSRYNYPLDIYPLDIGDESNTSTAINDYAALETTVNSISFSREYTFLQQEFFSETISLKVNIESNEAYVEAREGTGGFSAPIQIWIG